MYSDLANNSIFFSPRYQLFFAEKIHRNACKAWSGGEGQIALKENVFYVAGVCIHAVTRQEVLMHGPKVALWFNCDQWRPGMEMFLGSLPVRIQHLQSPHLGETAPEAASLR